MRLRPAGRKARILKTCGTVEIGRLHFDADRSLGEQKIVCVMRSVRARAGDGSSTAWQHYMLIAVGVVQGRPRRRLGADACVGLGYAVAAALVNCGVGAARRATWSCRGQSSREVCVALAASPRQRTLSRLALRE